MQLKSLVTAVFIFLLISVGLGLGCATAKKNPTEVSGGRSETATESHETFGPPVPPPTDSTTAQPSTYGPEPIVLRPAVLVFGPGLARGFAYVGVLEALNEAKIPIGAIFATEMGGLIAALYSMSTNMNQFEWGLLKFKADVFVEPKGFLLKSKEEPTDGQKMEAQLKQVFGKKDLSESKIPLHIVVQSKDTAIPILLDHGEATEVIRAALAVPTLFTASQIHGMGEPVMAVSANATRPFLINEAKKLEMGPVIVVNVLSEAESRVAQQELKGADLVIRPEMNGMNYMDFQKKADGAFRGKRAVMENLPQIRKLVGLPEMGMDPGVHQGSGNP